MWTWLCEIPLLSDIPQSDDGAVTELFGHRRPLEYLTLFCFLSSFSRFLRSTAVSSAPSKDTRRCQLLSYTRQECQDGMVFHDSLSSHAIRPHRQSRLTVSVYSTQSTSCVHAEHST